MAPTPQQLNRTNEVVPHRQQPWLRRPATLLLAIALIACSGLLAYKFDELHAHANSQPQVQPPAPPKPRPVASRTRTECLCVKSFEDVSALSQGNQEANAGLLSSDRAIWLGRGTSIKPFDADNEVTTVVVESGDSTGERCHLLTKLLE